MLVGRRLQSQRWLERHLTSSDARVRANVTEALWSVNSALAAKTFRKCLTDENNRVRGNALIGLHLLGDRSASALVLKLTKDRRPLFRQTAAWVMGRMDDPKLIPTLEQLLEDPDDGVRQSAAHALEAIHRPVINGPEHCAICAAESDAAAASVGGNSIGANTLPPVPPVESPLAGQPTQAEPEPAAEPAAVLSVPEPAKDATPEPKPFYIPFTLHLDGR